MSARTPSFAEVIAASRDIHGKAIRVAMPGKIVSFDPATQTASIQPMLTESRELEDGDTAEDQLAVLPMVPVKFARSGSFLMTMPVTAGDPCWLVFADRSIDRWFKLGRVVEPGNVRRHDLSDAVAFLGVSAEGDALTEFDTQRAIFGKVGGPRVAVGNVFVELGVSHGEYATEAAMLGNQRVTQEAAHLLALQNLATKLAGEVTAAASAVGVLSALNAVPVVGGALALPGFVLFITQLGLIASDFGALASAFASFSGQLNSQLSLKVKLK